MRYRHIDALFGEPGRNVIDWQLIEAHYADVMRVVLSVQRGQDLLGHPAAAAVVLLPAQQYLPGLPRDRPRIRTVQLLRFLSDAQLRRTTAETNKVESYNGFSAWCRFGNNGVIAANDPDEQEKILKFSTLMTNRHLPHHLGHDDRDPRTDRRRLEITAEPRRVLSPYVTARIQRFGVYATDEIALTPEPFNAHLGIDLAAAS